MQQLKIKKPHHRYRWMLSKREFGQYKKEYELGVPYEDVRKYLDNLYVYYLNELGLSIDFNGNPVEKDSAQYMWAQLDEFFNEEPLFVWMRHKGDGKFGNIVLGTRRKFDKEIVKNLQNKTSLKKKEIFCQIGSDSQQAILKRQRIRFN